MTTATMEPINGERAAALARVEVQRVMDEVQLAVEKKGRSEVARAMGVSRQAVDSFFRTPNPGLATLIAYALAADATLSIEVLR